MPRDPLDQNLEEVSHSDENEASRIEERARAMALDAQDQEEPYVMSEEEIDYVTGVTMAPLRSRTNNRSQRDDLHPFSQILLVSNVEDCVKVEDGAFPPHELCSREKV